MIDPYVKNPQAAREPGPFREGDRVRLLWGFTPVEGDIIEDRGNLGLQGRRLYVIRVQLDDQISPPMDIAMEAEELTLVAKAPTLARKQRRRKKASRKPDAGGNHSA